MTAVTATFKGLGIEFNYPANWQISQDDTTDFPRTISVHSPSGAFWSLTMQAGQMLPQVAAHDFKDAISAEYDQVDVTPITVEIDGEDAVGYELDFYCLDFLVTCRVVAFERNGLTLVLCYQGENRDYDQLFPVFEAVTHSLVRNLGESHADESE
ncbi:MAG: hypothetical protein R3C28_13320 [Pirellulaceae bacterium]